MAQRLNANGFIVLPDTNCKVINEPSALDDIVSKYQKEMREYWGEFTNIWTTPCASDEELKSHAGQYTKMVSNKLEGLLVGPIPSLPHGIVVTFDHIPQHPLKNHFDDITFHLTVERTPTFHDIGR